MPYPHQVPDRFVQKIQGVVDKIMHHEPEMIHVKYADPYDSLAFHAPNVWYNQRAPPFWIAWIFATLFTVAAALQYSKRVHEYRSHIVGGVDWSIRLRTLISAYIDTDDPLFVINKYTAQSMWFLGGMQLNYGAAFMVMMAVFAIESILDSLRVVIAYEESPSLEEYVPTSDYYIKPKNHQAIELQPSNVYEDLSRPHMIVLMVFLTQVLLIAMVLIDMYHTPSFTSMDGTPHCPVVGTLGSYVFYLLGTFLAMVFMLGPKTNYGSSEQNTSFWLQMLLTTKHTGACASWRAPATKKLKHLSLKHNDWRLWLRFVMSFVVNGIGFHVLIHALPIQVGSQSSFTLVVLRSVGMMYLVDLDDTAGCTLTLCEGEQPATANSADGNVQDEAKAIRKIIGEASDRLEALSSRKKGD